MGVVVFILCCPSELHSRTLLYVPAWEPSDLLTGLALQVTPIVGLIPSDLQFCPNYSEVDSVFTAPLRMFLEGGPTYYSKDVEWQEGFQYRWGFQSVSPCGVSF